VEKENSQLILIRGASHENLLPVVIGSLTTLVLPDTREKRNKLAACCLHGMFFFFLPNLQHISFISLKNTKNTPTPFLVISFSKKIPSSDPLFQLALLIISFFKPR
jgi:hypothetical protein